MKNVRLGVAGAMFVAFLASCVTESPPPPSSDAGGPGEAEAPVSSIPPTVPPTLPPLPPPPFGILAAQKALPALPPGLRRSRDGRIFSEKDGAELVLVLGFGWSTFSPGSDMVVEGDFTMGNDSSSEADEKPAHRVLLSMVLLDRHEVTNAQFASFVAATGYRTDAERRGVAHALVGDAFEDIEGADWRHPGGPGTNLEGMESHPVVLVSWNDAAAYGEWAGRRLPTEAEFERALRGGVEHLKFPWGNEREPPRGYANFSDEAAARAHNQVWIVMEGYEDGYPTTAPAGSFLQNALGLFDVSGNVWEWCSDWYGPYSPGTSPARDPKGPGSGELRIVRGGGWDCDWFGARNSCRDSCKPDRCLPYLGFRTAVNVK